MNRIAVLIPHYNNPEGLIKSVASVNPEEEADIIVVDDGSTHKPDEYLVADSYVAKGKIYFLYLAVNKGIEYALNTGLDYIVQHKYEYIARLDCGDICLGMRFTIQSKFLDEHPDVKLAGSFARAVDTEGNLLFKQVLPTTTAEIRKKSYLNSMFVHPAVMFRTEMINLYGVYPTDYKSAEDYAYFFKFVKNHDVANIDDFLVQIEINPKGISLTKRKQQVANRIRVIRNNFYFGFYPVYGLFRSVILYIMPTGLLLFLKKILFR